MNINNYYELKKKYKALLKENKFLKAKIRESESELREVTGNNIPILHEIFVRIQGVIMK